MIHPISPRTGNPHRLEQHTVAVIQPAPAAIGRDDILLKLPLVLQTTLDTRQLLKLFDQQVKPLLAQSGLYYSHPESNVEFRLGSNHHHKCNYQLEIDEELLGQLTLSRTYPFSASEIDLIEELLCKLVYPLRNSLQYTRVLNNTLTDHLTRLPNRQAYQHTIEREVDLAHRLTLPLSLLVIDIDHFKSINDSYGHAAGDEALCRVANILVSCLRRSDAVHRIGGEEFAVILSHTNYEAAQLTAERLRIAIAELTITHQQHVFPLSISTGLADLCLGESADHLFLKADNALYKAKAAGRNQVAGSRELV